MTREEAIARIKDHIEVHKYHEQNAVKIFEAFDMAIKALEQPEIIHCRECEWHGRQYYCGNTDTWGFDDNDFCSQAERRGEGENE